MDDLIRRQAAIDAMNQMMINRPLDSDRWVISDCLNKIVNLPSAQQWIPCSERLPEEDGLEVLFSSRFGRVHIGKYHNDTSLNRWFSYRDKIRLMNDEVTAWMPLLDCYQEEENNGHD